MGIVVQVGKACVLAQAIRIGVDIHIDIEEAAVIRESLATRRQEQKPHRYTQKQTIRTRMRTA